MRPSQGARSHRRPTPRGIAESGPVGRTFSSWSLLLRARVSANARWHDSVPTTAVRVPLRVSRGQTESLDSPCGARDAPSPAVAALHRHPGLCPRVVRKSARSRDPSSAARVKPPTAKTSAESPAVAVPNQAPSASQPGSPWKKSSGRFSSDENRRFSRVLRTRESHPCDPAGCLSTACSQRMWPPRSPCRAHHARGSGEPARLGGQSRTLTRFLDAMRPGSIDVRHHALRLERMGRDATIATAWPRARRSM